MRRPRWLRVRRVRVDSYSPEAWAMVEAMHVRVDREHAWVHRLEDEIAALRDRIDDALELCARAGSSKVDVAAALNRRDANRSDA